MMPGLVLDTYDQSERNAMADAMTVMEGATLTSLATITSCLCATRCSQQCTSEPSIKLQKNWKNKDNYL